jgi:hypothetical protein
VHRIAFASLGFLIGTLIGLTAQSVVAAFLPMLFAFAGGSLVAFLDRFRGEDRRTALTAIAALCLACLAGVYSSIAISERQLLSPRGRRIADQVAAPPAVADLKYLRADTTSAWKAIDQKVRTGLLSKDEGYAQLIAVLESSR